MMITTILATDLATHFKHIAEFKQLVIYYYLLLCLPCGSFFFFMGSLWALLSLPSGCLLSSVFKKKKKKIGKKMDSGVEDMDLDSEDVRISVLTMAIKCSDIGHPSKKKHLHRQWTELISEEMFRQGDLERERGLEISNLCDRNNKNIPKSQKGFIGFFVKPLIMPFLEW